MFNFADEGGEGGVVLSCSSVFGSAWYGATKEEGSFIISGYVLALFETTKEEAGSY